MVESNKLGQFSVFSDLSGDQLDKISEITEERSYSRADYIYQSGEKAGHLFVVMQGLVSLREFGPDDRVGVGFEIREKGDIFGCGSLTPACKYTLTAVCMEETKVLAVDADQLFKLCDIDTGLGYKLMKKVARIYFERFETAKKQIHEMVKIPTVIMALPG